MAGPLSGVRVIELAGIGPGPFAGMLLADLGAEVIRIDRPGAGPGGPALDKDMTNRSKRSVAVDLKSEAGREVVLRLVEQADALIEGFRPGVTERLGLGPEQCLERNPKLVYGRMTGWGQEGPLSHTAGHDIGYIAITGALHAIGRAGGPPQVPLNLLGDFAGGSMYLVVGVLAALLESKTSGKGQVVDAAIVDGTAHLTTFIHAFLASGTWQDKRGINTLDTGAPFYDVYETADGEHMAVGAIESQFYAEFLRRLGVSPEDAGHYDFVNWEKNRALFAEKFKEKTRDEWTEVFVPSDACVAPVLSMLEATEHPWNTERGVFVDTAYGAKEPAPAPRFSRTPGEITGPPSQPGRDTRTVLTDLGFKDVDELLSSGAVAER